MMEVFCFIVTMAFIVALSVYGVPIAEFLLGMVFLAVIYAGKGVWAPVRLTIAGLTTGPIRRRLTVGSLLLALSGTSVLGFAIAWPPSCAESAETGGKYLAPKYWFLDGFGVGHRIEDLVGPRALLIVRRAAPEVGGPAVPHVKHALVEGRERCAWKVAEVFSEDDRDWAAYGTTAQAAGALTFRRVWGLVKGDSLAPGADGYTMDAERWSALRGGSSLPCVVCFENGAPSACPSVDLSSTEYRKELRSCNGA